LTDSWNEISQNQSILGNSYFWRYSLNVFALGWKIIWDCHIYEWFSTGFAS